MIAEQIVAEQGFVLNENQIQRALRQGLGDTSRNAKILVLIPDHTRSLPLPLLFRTIVKLLDHAAQLDFMVALGTHPALDDNALWDLVGINPSERMSEYKNIGLLNHTWNDPTALKLLGTISENELMKFAGESWHPSLGSAVDVRINKVIFNYDHIIILGPTFPHEVAGFSGGAKYLFPGISGPEMIHATHWMGALAGVVQTIGFKNTPVRKMIHAAAKKIPVPITLIAMVIDNQDISGLFIGDLDNAWEAAADLSCKRHVRWVEEPFQRVLSCAPPMYDELWTAAKAMYKLEPVIEPGGEIIIYAPHLEKISDVHGEYIREVGYHVLPYFLEQWEQFKHIPLGVLAHSTHLRGSGSYSQGQESPNINVVLSSKISRGVCDQISLEYRNPAEIDISLWKNREDEKILHVPQAGEILYRVQK